jgi:predicted nuclease of restriction endonuclease-like (RecB) superfamily
MNRKSATLSRISIEPTFLPNLSWSHYVELLKEKRASARSFYAIETSKNHWSVRELARQRSALLYDRVSKSKNPDELLALEQQGHEITQPEDAIKSPVVLEFLGISEPHKLNETQLEAALINNLQAFLLELGKGFAFVARQQRLTRNSGKYFRKLGYRASSRSP